MTDEERYNKEQLKKELEHEAVCRRCGACCGLLDDDPCEHLKRSEGNRYACDIYKNRFGLRRTVKGEPVLCVPIRNMLDKSWWGLSRCAYIRRLV